MESGYIMFGHKDKNQILYLLFVVILLKKEEDGKSAGSSWFSEIKIISPRSVMLTKFWDWSTSAVATASPVWRLIPQHSTD